MQEQGGDIKKMQSDNNCFENILVENKRLKRDLDRQIKKNLSLELKLEHKQAMLKTNANGAFIMTDTFVDCNSQACKIWKTTKNDIIGKSPGDFAPPFQPNGENSHDMAKRKIQSALSGNPQHFLWKDKQADGTVIDTEVFLKPVSINGKKHVVASIKDVTQAKSMEKNSMALNKKMSSILSNWISKERLPAMISRLCIQKKNPG